jgi:hypothetical protein
MRNALPPILGDCTRRYLGIRDAVDRDAVGALASAHHDRIRSSDHLAVEARDVDRPESLGDDRSAARRLLDRFESRSGVAGNQVHPDRGALGTTNRRS